MEYIAGVVGLLWWWEVSDGGDEVEDIGDGGEAVVIDLGSVVVGEVGVGGRGALAVNLVVAFWDLFPSTLIICFLKSATVLSNWEANTTSSYVGGSSLESFSS